MYKLSYEKCVCFVFLVILVFLSCSGFHTDRLVTLTDYNKKYLFISSSNSGVKLAGGSDGEGGSNSDSNELTSRLIGGALELEQLAERRRRHAPPPPPPASLPSERGRRARRRRRPGRRPRFCPGQDVATRAFHAHIIIEGLVRSKRMPNKSSDYAVTVEVKKIHRNEPAYRALNITDIIRLYFANGQHKGCENKRIHGLVPAKLVNGDYYIFFLKSVGVHNYTVIGQPLPLDAKKIKQIQDIVVRKRVKPAKIINLQISNPSIKLNDKLNITCEVKGNPPPVITWFKDEKEIRRGKQQRIRIKHLEKKSYLVIPKIISSDIGRYECRAKSVIGNTASSSIMVSIQKDYPESPEGSSRCHCPSPQREEYCLNGGTCFSFGSLGELACRCSTGFNGQRCEHKDITRETSTYPRSWTCTLGLSNSYYC